MTAFVFVCEVLLFMFSVLGVEAVLSESESEILWICVATGVMFACLCVLSFVYDVA